MTVPLVSHNVIGCTQRCRAVCRGNPGPDVVQCDGMLGQQAVRRMPARHSGPASARSAPESPAAGAVSAADGRAADSVSGCGDSGSRPDRTGSGPGVPAFCLTPALTPAPTPVPAAPVRAQPTRVRPPGCRAPRPRVPPPRCPPRPRRVRRPARRGRDDCRFHTEVGGDGSVDPVQRLREQVPCPLYRPRRRVAEREECGGL